MPAEPLVGAVTTRPPPAFSSLTDMANNATHAESEDSSAEDMRRSRLSTSLLAARRRYISGARRGTSRPPGSVGVALAHPASIQWLITFQIRVSRSRTSCGERRAVSFAQTTSAMLRWCFRHRSIRPSHDTKGYGTPSPYSAASSFPESSGDCDDAGVCSWFEISASSIRPRRMNPPPIEYQTCSSMMLPWASNAWNRMPLGCGASRFHRSKTMSPSSSYAMAFVPLTWMVPSCAQRSRTESR